MTAPNAYRALSASFASSAKLGVQSLKVSANGQTADLVADGLDSVLAVFIDALVADVTLVVTDMSGVDTLKPGDVGALVVIFQKRAEGRAAAGSGNLTATLSNAVVQSSDIDAGTTGIGSGTVTFRCSSGGAAGGAVVWS